MVTEISNGKQTVRLYHSVNRGKTMYQLAYYVGGRRLQKNFSDKAQAKRVAKQILGELTNDSKAVEAMATPELESLIAARKVLAAGYALHVAVEEHGQAVQRLGKNKLAGGGRLLFAASSHDVPRLPLSEISDLFAKSREQAGLSAHYVFLCRKFTRQLAQAFPGHYLSDLSTVALEAWLNSLKLGPTTKNDMRRVLGTCGTWAEKQGYLLKGHSPFPGMGRYKEIKSEVSIFTPEQMASLLNDTGDSLRPYLALGAFAGLRTAEPGNWSHRRRPRLGLM